MRTIHPLSQAGKMKRIQLDSDTYHEAFMSRNTKGIAVKDVSGIYLHNINYEISLNSFLVIILVVDYI